MLGVQVFAQKSIYQIDIDSVSGSNKIHFSDFKQKKILIINAASNDTASSQLRELIQLKYLFKDSLVIVVIPSNSFGNELKTGQSLSQYYNFLSGSGVIVSGLSSVKGGDKNALYTWLTQVSENGILTNEVNRAYQKILINKQGKINGFFNAGVRPLSKRMLDALKM
jgi:glutathione peroxidase